MSFVPRSCYSQARKATMNWFNRQTLTRQFLVASFPIVLAGMLA